MMADLIDSAAGELQQAGNQLTRGGVRASVKVAAGTTRISVQMVGGVVRALVALLDAARQASRARSDEGELNLRHFTRAADGKREVLPIKDAEVARQLTRELRRHGVTFAIEKNADGTQAFHVQGKDAPLIEHALTAAAIKIDERIARTGNQVASTEKAPHDVSLSQETGTRTIALDEKQKSSFVDVLRNWGGGHGNTGTDPLTLADEIDHDSTVTLTAENVEAIKSALADAGDLPAHMDDIVAAVAEEDAALAVDAQDQTIGDATVPRKEEVTRERTPFEQARAWNEESFPEEHAAWELNYGNADTSDGRRSDENKLVRKWEAAQLDQKEQLAELTPAATHDDAQETQNPYLRDDLPPQDVPTVVLERDALEDVRGERADGAVLLQETSRTAIEKPTQQRPRGATTARDRSSRDATRERVAHRIEVKVDDMKRQQGGDAGARTTQRTQGDEPRLPISRR